MELSDNLLRLLELKYGIIGKSAPMIEAKRLAAQAAPTELSILITGETGTGKEVFANAIHGLSKRSKQPFISVNCAAIPENLLESELFGHEKGAFTSANERRKGFFEVAHKGTVFLDEIGEMPVGTQVKILRVLESGEFSRLGSSEIHKVDVRVIAATNRRLGEEVSAGNFRQDLYYRLNSIHIVLPPLRNHTEDVPVLSDYFAREVAEKLSIKFGGISKDALNILKSMHWLGNIRELKNLIDTIVTIEKGDLITSEMLRKYIPAALPAYEIHPQKPEKSLIPVYEPEPSRQIELGLIFKTLLEIKNDMTDTRRLLNLMAMEIEDLKHKYGDTFKPEVEEVRPNEEVIDHDRLQIADMEEKLITIALNKFGGNRRKAAEALGISERTLYRKITEYNINTG